MFDEYYYAQFSCLGTLARERVLRTRWCGMQCCGARWPWAVRPHCIYLFPALLSVTPHWLAETSHRVRIYTIEASKHYQLFLTCTPLLLLVFFTLFCGGRSVKQNAPHSPPFVVSAQQLYFETLTQCWENRPRRSIEKVEQSPMSPGDRE